MTIIQKISKAKAKLLIDYPLFGTIASKLELVLNDDIQSFKSNGIKLEYNSDFFQNLEISQMEFVFANGAMHSSLSHESRKNNRSGWLWQLATDYSINDMLVENGMDRPNEAHYSKRYSGLYAEEIYAELKADILREDENLEYEADNSDDANSNESKGRKEVNSENSNESSQDSEVNGLEESSLCNTTNKETLNQTKQLLEESKNENIQDEQLFAEFAEAVIEQEAKKDELPIALNRLFTLTHDAKINWRDELKAAIDSFHKDDYTLLPPNKKFLHLGIYLPSCISRKFKLVIAIDSSGSVDEELLNKFLSELNFLMNTVSNFEINLLVCDDRIQSHKTFYSGDILEVDLKGGGATDFRPVFKFIEDELRDTKLLLYFTDLDGIFPQVSPNYDVKWIAPKEYKIPFGEMIIINF